MKEIKAKFKSLQELMNILPEFHKFLEKTRNELGKAEKDATIAAMKLQENFAAGGLTEAQFAQQLGALRTTVQRKLQEADASRARLVKIKNDLGASVQQIVTLIQIQVGPRYAAKKREIKDAKARIERLQPAAFRNNAEWQKLDAKDKKLSAKHPELVRMSAELQQMMVQLRG